MISTGAEAARKVCCSADDRRHLAGEGKIVNAHRADAWKVVGNGCPRQALVPGSGPAEEPDRRGVSIAQIVQSVIEQGVC